MIVILLDEASLMVFRTLELAQRELEPLDVDDVRAMFDEAGVPYVAHWTRPNRKGWFGWITPGEYHFVPAGPADPQALVALIDEHIGESETYREELASLRSALVARHR